MDGRLASDFGVWALALLVLALALPARAANTVVVYYHTDALRSVAVITNAQGQVIERTHYAPYGAVLNRPLRDGPGYGGYEKMRRRASCTCSSSPTVWSAGGFCRLIR